jgi:hypothetical protein
MAAPPAPAAAQPRRPRAEPAAPPAPRAGLGRLGDLQFKVADTSGLEPLLPASTIQGRATPITAGVVSRAHLALLVLDAKQGVVNQDRDIAAFLRAAMRPELKVRRAGAAAAGAPAAAAGGPGGAGRSQGAASQRQPPCTGPARTRPVPAAPRADRAAAPRRCWWWPTRRRTSRRGRACRTR